MSSKFQIQPFTEAEIADLVTRVEQTPNEEHAEAVVMREHRVLLGPQRCRMRFASEGVCKPAHMGSDRLRLWQGRLACCAAACFATLAVALFFEGEVATGFVYAVASLLNAGTLVLRRG